MAVDVKAEVLIERSPEDVAEVMFNPKLDRLWIGGLSEVYPMSSGLYSKGARIERIGNFLSKHYSAKLLVTKFEENKKVQMFADEPFEMNIRYDLKKVDDATNVSLRITSVAEIPFNMPIPILSNKMQELIDRDLEKLKKHLEEA